MYQPIPRPDQIVVVIMDKQCPICGAKVGKTRMNHNYWLVKGDFDIGYENNNTVFGALCPWCDWRF